jgi:ribosome maturation factor RimP
MTIDPLGEQLREELSATAARSGCELLDIHFRGGVLRVVLDREGGVTLKDCETVSRELSALLDVEDFGKKRYTLEVSSPGLDRKLYRLGDYERFAGSLAKVTVRDESGKTTLVVRLEGLEEGEGGTMVVTSDPESGERQAIPIAHVEDARLEPEF